MLVPAAREVLAAAAPPPKLVTNLPKPGTLAVAATKASFSLRRASVFLDRPRSTPITMTAMAIQLSHWMRAIDPIIAMTMPTKPITMVSSSAPLRPFIKSFMQIAFRSIYCTPLYPI